MIFNVPIEPIPMRYSADWQRWFSEHWGSERIKVTHILGQELTKGIEQGRFLDCIGTNYYKSSQLMLIMQFIQQEVIKDGDVIFFHDLWFPGIEQIAYACDALRIKVKITGCLHAGSYDPNDFLYQQGMGRWALHFENMLFEIADKVFLATEFHKKLIQRGRTVNPDKLIVTGFPMKFDQMKFNGEKENLVVFPHRPDPEKNPNVYTQLGEYMMARNPEWKFINTKHCKTKGEYYSTLEKSKIAISVSDQETWGIAMQECVASGCIPLVPDRLSYSEMYHGKYLYSTTFDLLNKLQDFINKFDAGGDEAIRCSGQVMLQFNNFKADGGEAFNLITEELLS